MKNFAMQMTAWGVALTAAASWAGCASASVDADGNPVGATEQALSTALAVDFSSYALGPLGSPWTVTTSGTGTSTVVNTSDHGRALRVAHSAQRDYSSSVLGLAPTDEALEFQFAVRPKSSASTFSVTLKSVKSGYKVPRFSVSLVPGSNDLKVSSAAINGSCGKLPYGVWSTVNWSLVLSSAPPLRVMDVRVNGVLSSACTGVPTSLRSADTLVIMDNDQPSANTESLFDDFLVQTGSDGAS